MPWARVRRPMASHPPVRGAAWHDDIHFGPSRRPVARVPETPMDGSRFDKLTRSLARVSDRRRIFAGAATGLLAHVGPGLSRAAGARQRKGKKRKRQVLAFNEFGCVNVGGTCRGKNSVCCSGRCQGSKPKPGMPDRRRCVAHDTGGCTKTDRVCPSVPCTTSIGHAGGCATTTGNAPYCADVVTTIPCNKDADCEQYCGSLAACHVCIGVAGGRCAGPGVCTV
jgi:hypothetical protein